MSEQVTCWRYWLPNVKGEGWAEIVLCSTGFFGAVSDWGNYSFAWRNWGDGDFRAFVARLDPGYLMCKLGPQSGHPDRLDVEATVETIREHIAAEELAEDEGDYADTLEEEGEAGVDTWLRCTNIDEAHELLVYGPSRQLVAFVERAMPRLAEILREETK